MVPSRRAPWKTEAGDAAIKFDGCRAGILEGQRGEAGQAIGVVRGAAVGELIIDVAGPGAAVAASSASNPIAASERT